jgi:hypothetical protein
VKENREKKRVMILRCIDVEHMTRDKLRDGTGRVKKREQAGRNACASYTKQRSGPPSMEHSKTKIDKRVP